MNNGINHLSTGAGFLPSTVVQKLFPATCVGAQAVYTANQTWFAGTFPVESVECEGFFYHGTMGHSTVNHHLPMGES